MNTLYWTWPRDRIFADYTCALLCVASEERRFRLQFLKVPTDRDRFGDALAIVRLGHGDGAEGVPLLEFIGLLFPLDQIYLHGRNPDALLGEEDSNASRIRSPAA